ncbi:hypothetical protein HUZ36_16185 [Pseudoalteromonas sp. McH1-7]|uniref:Uncharacterized protein n=1 Tax=Pseudoalteromonas peptidolytica F12-50-A1 TaxID=1315280 RepID=A0A8I0MSQ9_9GAMM|nr:MULTISPECIES: hypothetical protein [Pseudoalteromonas]MBE0344738.1 hypothetical protein [Pseudoalteromonas peptidolytica F12-50-A1]MDW7551214.1 hypothetical protein [Pseudoalteromonas peptidolytica]NLR14464.1 hypothetical protein [Pseudoalteromonas peptidolytica]NUZ12323.1 hypothetical protein [Pseudoalteromonas sp. McH1-7]RRS10353.1 hypothetical protein EAG18_01995 [Pseudoalteromonas sp. J010]
MLFTYLLACAFMFVANSYSKSCQPQGQTKAKCAVLLSATLIAAAKWQAGLSTTVIFFVFAVSLGVLSLFITLAQPQQQ